MARIPDSQIQYSENIPSPEVGGVRMPMRVDTGVSKLAEGLQRMGQSFEQVQQATNVMELSSKQRDIENIHNARILGLEHIEATDDKGISELKQKSDADIGEVISNTKNPEVQRALRLHYNQEQPRYDMHFTGEVLQKKARYATDEFNALGNEYLADGKVREYLTLAQNAKATNVITQPRLDQIIRDAPNDSHIAIANKKIYDPKNPDYVGGLAELSQVDMEHLSQTQMEHIHTLSGVAKRAIDKDGDDFVAATGKQLSELRGRDAPPAEISAWVKQTEPLVWTTPGLTDARRIEFSNYLLGAAEDKTGNQHAYEKTGMSIQQQIDELQDVDPSEVSGIANEMRNQVANTQGMTFEHSETLHRIIAGFENREIKSNKEDVLFTIANRQFDADTKNLTGKSRDEEVRIQRNMILAAGPKSGITDPFSVIKQIEAWGKGVDTLDVTVLDGYRARINNVKETGIDDPDILRDMQDGKIKGYFGKDEKLYEKYRDMYYGNVSPLNAKAEASSAAGFEAELKEMVGQNKIGKSEVQMRKHLYGLALHEEIQKLEKEGKHLSPADIYVLADSVGVWYKSDDFKTAQEIREAGKTPVPWSQMSKAVQVSDLNMLTKVGDVSWFKGWAGREYPPQGQWTDEDIKKAKEIVGASKEITDAHITEFKKYLLSKDESRFEGIDRGRPSGDELRKQNTKEAYEKGVELGYWE